MVFFTLGLFLFSEAVRRDRMWLYALAGVVSGLTYSMRGHAIFLIAIVFFWQLSELRWEWRRWIRFASGLAMSLAAALATIPIAWPYYRGEFFTRFKETFATFSNHDYNEYVFYLGQHYRAREVPWHFPFVTLGVNTPLVYLFFRGAVLADFRRVGDLQEAMARLSLGRRLRIVS
jgi:4-amino-4-deoxy-L-arabinose transferase-like glycosyltransferase